MAHKLENLSVFFLMDTRLKDVELETIILKYDFNYCLGVSYVGELKDGAGGLALLWTDQVKITVISHSLHHNGAFYDINGDNVLFSGIYGYPEEQRKKDNWDLIRSLRLT